MPEAIIAIIIISIGCGTILGLTSMILKHRRSSKAIGSGRSDQGIRTSELKQMMREAAAEAAAPLEERIDELKALLEAHAEDDVPRLEAHVDDNVEFEQSDAAETTVPARLRTR